MQTKRLLHSRLGVVKESVTPSERHFTVIIVQGRREKYRDIKLTTYVQGSRH